MGQFRFVARNDPQDGSARIKVREASEEGPELWLDYDPDRLLPSVELSDEEAHRARQFVVLEEVSAEDAAEAKERQEAVARTGVGSPATFTEKELKGKSVPELTEIARGRSTIEEVPEKKEELVATILADQERGASA